MMNFTERIAAARGCDIFTSGINLDANLIAIIVREDDTVISSIKMSNGHVPDITSKNYVGKMLQTGELITFEKTLVDFTITSGSVMGYFN